MQEAKKFLEKMRTEFISQFSAQPGCNSVYQLNYQFFEMANLSQIDE
jgi:hypothetical protein